MNETPMREDTPRPQPRRKSASQRAYETGYARGFIAATELLRILRDPDTFIKEIHEVSSSFAQTLAAMSQLESD